MKTVKCPECGKVNAYIEESVQICYNCNLHMVLNGLPEATLKLGKNKMGRPLIGERKEHDTKVRLDETTHDKLIKYCKASGDTKAEAIRQALNQFLKYN